MIGPPCSLPAAPTDGKLWLSYWQWFSLSLTYGADQGYVELSTDDGVTWTTISPTFVGNGGGWTRHMVDLSAHAGQTVRIAFHLKDVSSPYIVVDVGWYVDDVEVLEGPLEAWSPEGFEDGIGGWYAERGSWQVGTPTSGPGSAHAGTQCAGTVLNGDYPYAADTRLVSPPVTLNAAPAGGKLWLSFWHWFSLAVIYGPDQGYVELSTDNGASWDTVSVLLWGDGGGWTRHLVDLSAHAGQTVRFAFHLRDVSVNSIIVGPGWFVDDVEILEGALQASNREGFEGGIGGWYAERGSWQVGTPTSGPGSAHTGSQCAGTVLNGNYPFRADTRLIGPPVTLGASPALSFWHWHALATSNGTDQAYVELSSDDGVSWDVVSNTYTGASPGWVHETLDLSAHSGETVRIAFRLLDITVNALITSAGWYIDDIEITPPPTGGEYTRAYWRFEEGGGDSTYDHSGLGNHGELRNGAAFSTNIPWSNVPYTGIPNTGALALDGVNDAVVVRDAPSLRVTGNLTLEATIKPDPGARVVVGKQLGPGCCANSYQLEIRNDSRASFILTEPSGIQHPLVGPVVSTGQWHHVAGVWDGALMKFYLDCDSVAAAPFAGPIGYDSNPVIIGADDDGSGQPGCCFFGGSMDEMRLTAAALKPSQFLCNGAVTGIEPPGAVPMALELSRPAPNPARSGTSVTLALPKAGWVRLKVVDVAGRQVQTLGDGYRVPGRYEFRWDRTSGSRVASAGVYFIRLEALGETRVRKVLVLD